jgi:hypothetical protein
MEEKADLRLIWAAAAPYNDHLMAYFYASSFSYRFWQFA